ncbi:MAG: hypothetical protein GY757_44780 [bacterium]|nr:hypothetical protein [bacterium]
MKSHNRVPEQRDSHNCYCIYETKEVNWDNLEKMLEESKIEGGEIMITFAQQLRNEGKEIGVEQERQIVEQERQQYKQELQKLKQEKQKSARELVNQGVNLDIVAGAIGIPVEDLKKML